MATPPVPPPGLAGLTIGLTGLGLGVATAHCLAHSSARGKPRRAFAAAGGSSGMMEAAVVERHGGPEVLKLRTVPVPMPGEGELLVRQAVCGVNFIDTHIRAGEHSSIDTRPTPFICGIEGAGTVVGAGGGGFTPGDRVVYSGTGGSPTAGAYAEYAAVPADSLVRLPSAVGFEDGCAALICGTTAHYLVHDSYPVQPGDWVVVHAAAGGVGRALVQMAKLRGAKVIGTCSTAAKAGAARRCGADHAVLYTGPDGETWAAAVRRLTGGGGVACVFDGVGRATFMEGFTVLRPHRGHLVLFGESSGPVPPVDPGLLTKYGSVTLSYPTGGHFGPVGPRAAEVFKWVAEGRLVMESTVLPLKEAAASHRMIEARGTVGKLLLAPAHSAGPPGPRL